MWRIKNYITYINEKLNSYKELEFVCHNSFNKNSTKKEDQRNFFERLKQLQKETDYSVLPYMQDFSDNIHDEISLAIILLKNDDNLEHIVLSLANKYNVEFDLYNYRNDKEVDQIINGSLYDNLILESKSNKLKESFIKRMKKYKCSAEKINSGYCEDIAHDVLRDMGGQSNKLYIIDDGWFWSSEKPITRFIKNKFGEYWDLDKLDEYGALPFPEKYLKKFDLAGHTWIYYNGKHYDAETLDGVDNFWMLPIYKRQLSKI